MTDAADPPVDPTADAEARIRELRRTIEDGENALDAGPINGLLAEDVVLYGPGSRVVGRDAVAQHHRELYASASTIDISFDVADVSIVGPVAAERGRYQYTAQGKSGDDAVDGEGEYLTVYERAEDGDGGAEDGDGGAEDGEWEILRIVWA